MELVTKTFIPKIGTEKSAGIDLACKKITIKAGEIAKIPLETKVNFRCDLHPRSSLATKYGLWGQMGVIDEDYRGEICLVVQNTSKKDITVDDGIYVAQVLPYKKSLLSRILFFLKPEYVQCSYRSVGLKHIYCYEIWDKLYPTERKGGFGSTDIS